MDLQVHVTPVGEALAGGAPARLLRVRCSAATTWVGLPGVFQHAGEGDFDAASIASVPLFPWFCKVRVPPQQFGDAAYMCGLYVKAPVVVFCTAEKTVGVRFSPYLRGENDVPLFFSFRRRAGETVFELVALDRFTLGRRSEEQFKSWTGVDRTLPEETVQLAEALSAWRGAGPVDHEVIEADSIGGVLRQVAAGARAEESPVPFRPLAEVAPELFRKSLGWSLAMQSPWVGAYLTFRPRHPAMGMPIILPTYNNYAADAAALARQFPGDARLARFSQTAKAMLLRPAAHHEPAAGQLVFRNTAQIDPTRRRVQYSDHLGVGLAGYPGGQATALKALVERRLLGDTDDRLADVAQRGTAWLRAAQGADGGWCRSYAPPHFLTADPGEEVRSIGACAEGAMALLGAYEAFGRRADRDAAEKALGLVAEHIGDTMATTGFFRDCAPEETEGASAIFAGLAMREAARVLGDAYCSGRAETALNHALGWHRWWLDAGMDSIQHSFTPRVALVQSVWAAEAYWRQAEATGDVFWREAAGKAIACLAYDALEPGFGDGVYNDEWLRPHPVGFDSSYAAGAVLHLTRLVLGERLRPGDVEPLAELPDFSALFVAPTFANDLRRAAGRAVNAFRKAPAGTVR
jgi:hypothetical protein